MSSSLVILSCAEWKLDLAREACFGYGSNERGTKCIYVCININTNIYIYIYIHTYICIPFWIYGRVWYMASLYGSVRP